MTEHAITFTIVQRGEDENDLDFHAHGITVDGESGEHVDLTGDFICQRTMGVYHGGGPHKGKPLVGFFIAREMTDQEQVEFEAAKAAHREDD